MSFPLVDLSSDEDVGNADEKKVLLETVAILGVGNFSEADSREAVEQQKAGEVGMPGFADDIIVNTLDRNYLPPNQERVESDAYETASVHAENSDLICRQFWKAGNYHIEKVSKIKLTNGGNYMRVHPKFLHSNATSHKWALGAIAELLDNAVDEIHNGATFVKIDKVVNPRDRSPALLIQDDGGGMDPECIRQCMSLGYSEKELSAIGQYGNGFKTSTMRLGADVIVFTSCKKKGICSQSIGLLSYTFLTKTGLEDTVVPMVDYELSPTTRERNPIIRSSKKDWSYNMSTILRWSPYQTETDLLKEFDDIGHQGTKVVVYNLWLNDDGEMELDFENDEEDIQITGAPKLIQTHSHAKMLQQMHVANRFRYSLRVYASILYLHLPKNFSVVLRGKTIEPYSIADGLKYPEYILYRPQNGENKEASVITTIGFVKEAPHVSVHGFNVYHKNRLIMPFWRVWSDASSRGRGVVGVLEANFIEPAHDKQEFEKTVAFQKLENRLKDMALEYWNLRCGWIGYLPKIGSRYHAVTAPVHGPRSNLKFARVEPVDVLQQESSVKRKLQSDFVVSGTSKRVAVVGHNTISNEVADNRRLQEARELLEENEKLRDQCKEYEKVEKEFELKVQQLEKELQEVQSRCTSLLIESQNKARVKRENS